ncbi:S-adenosyl-L-methionine-dependent methyltransferase [Phellopilus nigrolimitatus]|nr:S-adenosyl-L-methionine-dependent methyltransferase [Phellopilus nigrolimitatus]
MAVPHKVDPISEAGFGKGKSELYDKARASYAPEVLSHIRKAVSRKDGLNIVELGCGSGILTRALLAQSEWSSSISELRCIDPNEGMRDVFSKTVDDPRVSLTEGTFDSTGVPDLWADLIVSASAYHWCTDHEAAFKEFVRILKPDGTICFLWNPDDPTKAAWVQQVHDVCIPYRQKTTTSVWDTITRWRAVFDLTFYKDNFQPPDEMAITLGRPITVESVKAYYLTWSGVSTVPDSEKEKIKEKIGAIISRGDDLVWVDEKERVLEIPITTPVAIMQRKH